MDEKEQQYMIESEVGVGPYSCDISCYYDGECTPDGRGIPIDMLDTGADCGPSSIAAYLQISTAEAIELLPLWKSKRRHSSKRTLEALAQVGLPHKMINLGKETKALNLVSDKFPVGFAEIRFLKSNKKEFSIRHTIAYDKNKSGELLIYDCNAFASPYGQYADFYGIQGFWISEEFWSENILNWGGKFLPERPVDFYLSHILVPVNKK